MNFGILSLSIFIRSNLHSLVSRNNSLSDVTNPSSHTNYRFLTTPEKVSRMQGLQKRNKSLMTQVKRLRTKIEAAIEADGVILDDQACHDLETIMENEDKTIDEKFQEDSFQYIFWKQQKYFLSKESNQKKGIRWHPLMIKLCLYLRHQSSTAYETLHSSGCLALPSQRTLRDYSNAVKSVVGFSKDVDIQLMQAARLLTSPDHHKLIIVLIDEMHIKEELVYNKHNGWLIGFIDLGNINNHLARFEDALCDHEKTETYAPPLANSMVALMVKGLFTPLQFTYAHFPCLSLAGEQLFNPFWEAVFRLERIGFKVCVSLSILYVTINLN